MAVAQQVKQTPKYGDIVDTPIGRGTIEGLFVPPVGSPDASPESPNRWADGINRFIIRYSRRDFDPTLWRQSFSPLNGPSVSRTFQEQEITIMESAPSTAQESNRRNETRRRQAAASRSASGSSEATGQPITIPEVGQIFVSNKGGYRYRVTAVDQKNSTVDIEWVDNAKDKQTGKPLKAFVSRYSPEGTVDAGAPDEDADETEDDDTEEESEE